MAAKSRLVFARTCININQMIDMPQSIDIISKLGKWTQAIEYESLPFSYFHCKKSGYWEKSCLLKKSKESKIDSNVKYKKTWKTIDKKGDSSVESDQNKDVTKLVNEVKKDENSNNEKQDCVCSNNQIESSKEGEKGLELNNKYN